MYANHDVKYSYWNWHKWGADADSLLFNPRVGMEDWKKIVHRVITQYFHLPNYVKIGGCPVFAMFNADIFRQGFSSDEEAAGAMEYFREEVRKAGFPGLHLQLTPGGGSDPSAKKQEHMREATDAHRDTQPPFVMINAWNEWVEGSYLLPDKVTGFGYLKAVGKLFK